MNIRTFGVVTPVTVALILSASTALSAPITVPSGDVAALTNALKTCATWSTVVLEAGEYDLSCLTNAPMGENTSYQGRSLLSLTTGVTLKGNTGKPEDVVLKGCGRFRILQHANGCAIKDLTMTGGRAEEGSFPVGGAVFATGSAISITNCRFLYNFASAGGGAVYIDNCKDCLFYGNQSGPGWNKGGGAGYLGTYDNCRFFCNTNSYEWAEGGALGYATKVVGCTVVSNFSGYCGGGLCKCKNVSDCTISYNAVVGSHNARGGGAYGCGVATNCTVIGNAASSFGSGFCDTGAYDSRFFFNGNTHFSKRAREFPAQRWPARDSA